MKSFVKALWSRTKKEGESRELAHPRELDKGDLVKLSDSYGLPGLLRDQTFKVVAVSTYQFEFEFETNFSLESERDDRVDLLIEEEDGREVAAFSLAVERSTVEQLFDLDQFGDVFDEESQTVLELQGEIAEVAGWTAPFYRQEACAERGYFYKRDYRGSKPPTDEGEGEPMEYYCLVSDDGACAVEIEVWSGGETDVALTVYRPLSDIKELWPGGAS